MLLAVRACATNSPCLIYIYLIYNNICNRLPFACFDYCFDHSWHWTASRGLQTGKMIHWGGTKKCNSARTDSENLRKTKDTATKACTSIRNFAIVGIYWRQKAPVQHVLLMLEASSLQRETNRVPKVPRCAKLYSWDLLSLLSAGPSKLSPTPESWPSNFMNPRIYDIYIHISSYIYDIYGHGLDVRGLWDTLGCR